MVAGQQLYFFISTAYNQTLDQAEANGWLVNGAVPTKHAIEYCQLMAPAEEAFASAVAAGPWPESAQDEAAALAQASAAAAGQAYACAAASTGSAALAHLTGTSVDDAASAMRLALGLPINRS